MQAFGSALPPSGPNPTASAPWPRAGATPPNQGSGGGDFAATLQQMMEPGDATGEAQGPRAEASSPTTRQHDRPDQASSSQESRGPQPKTSTDKPEATPAGTENERSQRAMPGSAIRSHGGDPNARNAVKPDGETAREALALTPTDQPASTADLPVKEDPTAADGDTADRIVSPLDGSSTRAVPTESSPDGPLAASPHAEAPARDAAAGEALPASEALAQAPMPSESGASGTIASAPAPTQGAAHAGRAITPPDAKSQMTKGEEHTKLATEAAGKPGGTEASPTEASGARFAESLLVAQAQASGTSDGGRTSQTGSGMPPAMPTAGPLPLTPAQASGLTAQTTTTPAADALIPTPLQQPGFAPALGTRITTLVKDGIERASIRLNPAEMGPVAVKLALEGTQVRVEMSADMAVTRQVLEQALPSLASALKDAGFTLTGGGVFQQPQDQRQADGRPTAHDSSGHARQGANAAPDITSEDTLAGRRNATRGLVDLFA